MPSRFDIIKNIGEEYLVQNMEAGEYSYPQAFKKVGKDFKSKKIGTY